MIVLIIRGTHHVDGVNVKLNKGGLYYEYTSYDETQGI